MILPQFKEHQLAKPPLLDVGLPKHRHACYVPCIFTDTKDFRDAVIALLQADLTITTPLRCGFHWHFLWERRKAPLAVEISRQLPTDDRAFSASLPIGFPKPCMTVDSRVRAFLLKATDEVFLQPLMTLVWK